MENWEWHGSWCREIEKERYEEREHRYRYFSNDLHLRKSTDQAKIIHSIKRKVERCCPSPLNLDENSLANYSQYFSGMYARRNIQPPPATPFVPDQEVEECPFGETEMRVALNAMPKGKVPGANGIRSEYLSPVLSPWISVHFSIIWRSGMIPSSWKVGSIVSLPKREI